MHVFNLREHICSDHRWIQHFADCGDTGLVSVCSWTWAWTFVLEPFIRGTKHLKQLIVCLTCWPITMAFLSLLPHFSFFHRKTKASGIDVTSLSFYFTVGKLKLTSWAYSFMDDGQSISTVTLPFSYGWSRAPLLRTLRLFWFRASSVDFLDQPFFPWLEGQLGTCSWGKNYHSRCLFTRVVPF